MGWQRLRARQQVAHGRQQGASSRRKLHAALGAIEKAYTQRRLKPGNGLGQRGLGHVNALRRAAKVKFLGDSEELAPLSQFDTGFVTRLSHIQNVLMHRQ